MVEFYSTNPATTARYKEDEQARMRAGELRMQEEAFRQRYATEKGVAVDAAIRRGLGGGLGGVIADGSGGAQAQPRPQAGPAPDANGIAWQPPPQGQPQTQPQGQPQPQTQPQGGNLMRELTSTPGGGALALEQNQAQRQREDALEDRAWEFYKSGDIQAASTLLMQATGQDMPAFWKTKEAMLRARAADAEAVERFPTDMDGRRKFIEAYMADPGNALNTMIGEGPQATPVTVQPTSTGFTGISHTPGQGYSAEPITGAGGYTPQPAARTGGSAQYLWDVKRKAYLALHEGDEEGALLYASGAKQIPEAEIREAALVLAQKMTPEPFPGEPTEKTYAEDVIAKAAELYSIMTQGFKGPPGGVEQPGGLDPAVGPPGGVVQPSAPPPAGPEAPGAAVQPPAAAPEERQDFAAEGADVQAWRQRRGGVPDVMDAGIGTRENPIVPQSQADIDTAPPGSFIMIDGALWEKP